MSDSIWTGFMTVLKILYSVCIISLSLYGVNSLVLTTLYLLSNRRRKSRTKWDENGPWPHITIQLPIYNESYIVDRLLNAMVEQDYPRECLQIQVLDDSTDDTTEKASCLVDEYQAKGIDIQLIHRTNRTGYKAGALANGMSQASGDFLAIFDADFVPPRQWLRRVMAEFTDPEVGCMQTRWGHLNSNYNLLTRAETLMLDGHFVVEQGARYGSNLFMGFNGSGGIWRKKCIEDAGGWQSDTLTEDLDLSYRAQLKGWRIEYLSEVVVPGELPAQLEAFKSQQYRWAKGSIQTFRKLAKTVITADLPLRVRLAALMHLSMYAPFPFAIMILLLTLPIVLYASPFIKYFPFSILATLGPPLMYAVSRTNHLPRFRDRLLLLPLISILGIGISLNTGAAVFAGLFTKGGVFNRTPKFNLRGRKDTWVKEKYLLPSNPVVYGELLMGVYALYSVYILWTSAAGKGMALGVILYAVGFLFVAGMSFVQSWQQYRRLRTSNSEGNTAVTG